MIERAAAEKLYDAYQRALGALGEAEAVLLDLPASPFRDKTIEQHVNVVVGILSRLRAPLVIQYRDLDTEVHAGPRDTLLHPDEQVVVDRLTPGDTALIDKLLIAECVPSWQKGARIIGGALAQRRESLADVPLGYFAQRVKALVVEGRLEAQGNLDFIRSSEVRLQAPEGPDTEGAADR